MTALVVLGPAGFIGLILWVVIGIRQRDSEPFTLPGAASFYAQVITILSSTMALLGVALLIKVIIGFINLGFSYGSGSLGISSSCPAGVPASECPTPTSLDFTPQRTDDLSLAITLIVIGVVALWLHRLLRRSMRRLPGGAPAWVERGTVVAFTFLYAFAGLFGLVAAVHGIVSYIITPATAGTESLVIAAGQPFGDVVGAAAVFIPAWFVAALVLMRRIRPHPPQPPGHSGYTAVPA